jgi:L-ascorbate metabolism protein UlaG (beta-lactamase superfamily)
MKQRLKQLALLLAALFVAFLGVAGVQASSRVGAAPRADRLDRMQHSPQWKDGRFTNVLPRVDGPPGTIMQRWVGGGSQHRVPSEPVPTVARTRADYDTPPASGLRVTWLGHSTLLVEIDGQRVLMDPVWGERASPFTFMGPIRWYAPPLPLDQLPPVDVVVISHDHYDHLDTPTITELGRRGTKFAVPLGIGAHLEAWGVPPANITELDWWQDVTVGALKLTAAPARHFSGRWLTDQNRTLWCGWAVKGPVHNVYYSGDTALFETFAETGQRLGPFDLTMLEVGAYDALWADVHLGPEQAVRAHQMLRGAVLLPVHWGLFDLALHAWTEPMERTLAAASKANVRVVTPRPGARVEPTVEVKVDRWWPDVPWRTAEEAPVQSSGVEHLMKTGAVANPG